MTREGLSHAQYWIKQIFLHLMRRTPKPIIKTATENSPANNNNSDEESDNEDQGQYNNRAEKDI